MFAISALLLLSAAPDAGMLGDDWVERDAIIWSGATHREEARAQLDAFASDTREVSALFALPVGFPRVVDSSTVQGLKPGFQIVVLGFCAEGLGAQPVALFRGINGGAYRRTVKVPPGDGCPTVREDLQVQSVSLPLKKASTVVVSFLQWKEELHPGESSPMLRGWVWREGRLVQKLEFDTVGPAWNAESDGFRLKGNEIQIDQPGGGCVDKNCCAERIKVVQLSLDANGELLRRDKTDGRTYPVPCD
jgi:hypothetical protein